MEVTTYSKGQDRLIKIIYEIKKTYVFKGILCLYFHFFPEKKSMLILMPFPYEILKKNSLKKLNIYDTLEDNV